MLKQLKSFLKILWSHIWPTAKPFMPKMPDGFVMPSPSKKLMKRYGTMGGIAAGLTCHNEEEKPAYLKTSEEYYNLPEKPTQIYVDGKPVKGLIPPKSIFDVERRSREFHARLVRSVFYCDSHKEPKGEVSEQSVILPMMDEVYENTMILGDIIKKINSPETREAIDNALMDLFDYGECRMPDINFSIKRRGAV